MNGSERDLLQPLVLALKLPEPTSPLHAQAPILLAPPAVHLLSDRELLADLTQVRSLPKSDFSLADLVDDLFGVVSLACRG